jgi:hypothetical protein
MDHEMNRESHTNSESVIIEFAMIYKDAWPGVFILLRLAIGWADA